MYVSDVILFSLYSYSMLQGGPKNWHIFCSPLLHQILTDFQTYFTVWIRRTLVMYCH